MIREELAAERDARRSLEQRALSLFASAGVVAGLAGVAGRGASLPTVSWAALVLSIVALGVGAILGLLVAFPILVDEALKPDDLLAAVGHTDEDRGEWDKPEDSHARRASRARVRAIRAARAGNQSKARILRWGVGFAIAGVVMLLFAVVSAAIVASA